MKLNLKENITEVIAIMIIIGSFLFLFIAAFKPIPVDNKDMVNLTVGFVIGSSVSGVIGYYFGTSKKRDNITAEPGQSVTNIQKSIVTDVTNEKSNS